MGVQNRYAVPALSLPNSLHGLSAGPLKQSKLLVLKGLKMVLTPAREKTERQIAGSRDSERPGKVREVQAFALAIIVDAIHDA